MLNILKINKLTGAVKELAFKEFVFPAGEVSIKLNANDYAFRDLDLPITIVARIQNSDDLIKLVMLKDALARFDNRPVNLYMPYTPYARQDRVCDKGESFSLKVFGNLINSLNFNKVTVVDPHSGVTEGVIDRLNVISQLDVVNGWIDLTNAAMGCALVSPDAGSNKKTADVAGYLGKAEFIRADKLRDLTNGKIKEIVVYADNLAGRPVLILDDLCERGGTFIGLAKALKEKGAGKIILYVTHGVFANKDRVNVIGSLLTQGIDEIWTTDSYHPDLDTVSYPKFYKNLRVFKLMDKFYDKV